jgi:hypothetical protein
MPNVRSISRRLTAGWRFALAAMLVGFGDTHASFWPALAQRPLGTWAALFHQEFGG